MAVVDAQEIMEYVVAAPRRERNFYTREEDRKIRTAVVECSYTDVASLMKSVQKHAKQFKVSEVRGVHW